MAIRKHRWLAVIVLIITGLLFVPAFGQEDDLIGDSVNGAFETAEWGVNTLGETGGWMIDTAGGVAAGPVGLVFAIFE